MKIEQRAKSKEDIRRKEQGDRAWGGKGKLGRAKRIKKLLIERSANG